MDGIHGRETLGDPDQPATVFFHPAAFGAPASALPLGKLEHSELEFSAVISLAGRSGNDEGIKVHGRPEGVQLLKVLAVVDPRFSYRAEDVVTSLERVCGFASYPKTIRVGQGSEFVSRDLDLDLWA